MLKKVRNLWERFMDWCCEHGGCDRFEVLEAGRVKGWGWKYYEIKRCVRCGRERREEWWNG